MLHRSKTPQVCNKHFIEFNFLPIYFIILFSNLNPLISYFLETLCDEYDAKDDDPLYTVVDNLNLLFLTERKIQSHMFPGYDPRPNGVLHSTVHTAVNINQISPDIITNTYMKEWFTFLRI